MEILDTYLGKTEDTEKTELNERITRDLPESVGKEKGELQKKYPDRPTVNRLLSPSHSHPPTEKIFSASPSSPPPSDPSSPATPSSSSQAPLASSPHPPPSSGFEPLALSELGVPGFVVSGFGSPRFGVSEIGSRR